MPQASDEDRAYYKAHFGFPNIGCEHAIEFLKKRGFRLTEDWDWITPGTGVTEDERFLIGFLVREWDFGGVRYE